MGDQQKGNKYTGEPCVYHRCFAPRDTYFDAAEFEIKTMKKVRWRVEIAVEGGFMKDSRCKWIVRWDADYRNVHPASLFFCDYGNSCDYCTSCYYFCM